ncbi:MAG: hypothetical protein RL119_1937, partial [Actinomycetota bacterium]
MRFQASMSGIDDSARLALYDDNGRRLVGSALIRRDKAV